MALPIIRSWSGIPEQGPQRLRRSASGLEQGAVSLDHPAVCQDDPEEGVAQGIHHGSRRW